MGALNQLLEEKQYVLERVQGLGEHDQPVFAYLLMRKSKLEDFRNALATRDVDIGEFGIIVATGEGEQPPAGMEEDIIRQIRENPQSLL